MTVEAHEEVVATKVWDLSLFRRLLRFAVPHKRLFAQSFAVLLGLFALELVAPWIWRAALDGPVRAAIDAPPDTPRDPFLRQLAGFVGLYLGVVAVQAVMRFLEVSTLARTGQAVVHDLRREIFRHLQRLDLYFFDQRPTGALVTRVTTDVENLSEMFTSGVVSLTFDLLKVTVVLGFLFTIHPVLAAVSLAMTPVLIGISIAFRGGARRAHRKVRAELARTNGYLQEVLQGIRVVQVFRREDRVSGVFAEHLARYYQANKRTIFLFALFFPAMSLGVYLVQGASLGVGVVHLAGQDLTMGEFTQFWFYLNLMVRPIRELGERYNILQSAFASAERIFQVLETKPTIVSPPGSLDLGERGRAPHVRFEDVAFGYGSGRDVVSGIDFEIPSGATVALVGATGAGKSTLVNLLLRFYDPSHGRITLDGRDLDSVDLADYRSRLGLVLQEDFLFAGTVRENLIMDRPEVDEDSLEEALDMSRAGVLVDRLDGGLEAEVAERGATFSTGERQLLAIARALAGRPDLVILDEATASVDSETEARIEEATSRLLEGRSALVVAHRLSTIRRADEILVLDQGRIVERGTHEELLEQRGAYARLHALQFLEEDLV